MNLSIVVDFMPKISVLEIDFECKIFRELNSMKSALMNYDSS